jgi:hypothetical protein
MPSYIADIDTQEIIDSDSGVTRRVSIRKGTQDVNIRRLYREAGKFLSKLNTADSITLLDLMILYKSHKIDGEIIPNKEDLRTFAFGFAIGKFMGKSKSILINEFSIYGDFDEEGRDNPPSNMGFNTSEYFE